MKFRKLVSVFAAFAMLASMAVTANAAITAEKPAITLEYGEYEVFEDGGTTYYDIEVTVKQTGYQGFVTYSTSGRQTIVETVTGIAAYEHAIQFSNDDFYSYEAYNADGSKSAAQNGVAVAFQLLSDYITTDSTLGKYIIETTDPDASVTASLSKLFVYVPEIASSQKTDEIEYSLANHYGGTISVDIPSYNEMNAPTPSVTAPTVDLTVADGAVDNTNYFKATITKGSEDITAAGIDVTGDGVTKNYVVDSVDLSDVAGGVSFYVGNVWSSAKPAFSATAYATTATGTTNSAVVTD